MTYQVGSSTTMRLSGGCGPDCSRDVVDEMPELRGSGPGERQCRLLVRGRLPPGKRGPHRADGHGDSQDQWAEQDADRHPREKDSGDQGETSGEQPALRHAERCAAHGNCCDRPPERRQERARVSSGEAGLESQESDECEPTETGQKAAPLQPTARSVEETGVVVGEARLVAEDARANPLPLDRGQRACPLLRGELDDAMVEVRAATPADEPDRKGE